MASSSVSPSSSACRAGFSLLELLLALALASIALGLVSAAVYMQVHALNTRRTQVEEAQLARAVLRRMADDLASTVWHSEPDFSTSADLAANQANSAVVPTTGDSAEKKAAGENDAATASSGIAGQAEPPPVPGLYGNRYELQIDASRLPRLDEFAPGFAEPGVLHSDLKTVAYYLVGQGTTVANSHQAASSGGLVRRELNRSAAQYAAANGGDRSVGTIEEVLAPEVILLEFRYFDGESWQTEWDSNSAGKLPLAIEIGLAIIPQDAPSSSAAASPDALSSTANATVSDTAHIYRLVVAIPTAEGAQDQSSESNASGISDTESDSSSKPSSSATQ